MNRLDTAKSIHQTAIEKGWWKNHRSTKTVLMLAITELAEGVEADRNGKRADIPNYHAEVKRNGGRKKEIFKALIKDSVEDEIADAYIRLLDHLYHEYEENIRIPLGVNFDMNGTLADDLFDICDAITEFNPELAVRYIELLCDRYRIDLDFHVEEKMLFNQGREEMHGGKKY